MLPGYLEARESLDVRVVRLMLEILWHQLRLALGEAPAE
jgi:hypothetical protein